MTHKEKTIKKQKTMKRKIMLFGVLIGMVLGFSACSSEDNVAQNGDGGTDTTAGMKTITLTGGYGETTSAKGMNATDTSADTRMGVNYSTRIFYWETDDIVTVWASTNGTDYTSYSSSKVTSADNGKNIATFTSSIPDGATDYPIYVTYNSDNTKGSLSVTIAPTTQGLKYGTGADVSGKNASGNKLPVLAQCTATKATDGSYNFTLKHKLAYIYIKAWDYNGSTVAGRMSATDGMNITYDGTATYNTTTFASTTGAKAAFSEGYVYAVVPTKETKFYVGTTTTAAYTAAASDLKPSYFYTMNNNKTEGDGKIMYIGDYYEWDAVDAYPVGYTPSSSATGAYHSSYCNENSTLASQSCKGCPPYDDIVLLLANGVYWDEGTVDGNVFSSSNTSLSDNAMTYTADGKVCHAGLWVKKKSAWTYKKIDDIPSGYLSKSGVQYNTTSSTFTTIKDASGNTGIRTNSDYMFLPAAGYLEKGSFKSVGSIGFYWSSTPFSTLSSSAYNLSFYSGYASAYYYYRIYGYLPWSL